MAQPRLQRPVHLVLDFDSTITERDTMFLFSRAVQKRDLRLGRPADEPPMPNMPRHVDPGDEAYYLPPLPPTWSWNDLVTAYAEDYHHHRAGHFPTAPKVTPAEFSRWLASLKQVELNSVDRVRECGYFKHVKAKDLELAVTEAFTSLDEEDRLDLREGWFELFDMFREQDEDSEAQRDIIRASQLTILSVNWSATLIRLVLRIGLTFLREERDGVVPEFDPVSDFIDEHVDVIANELEGVTFETHLDKTPTFEDQEDLRLELGQSTATFYSEAGGDAEVAEAATPAETGAAQQRERDEAAAAVYAICALNRAARKKDEALQAHWDDLGATGAVRGAIHTSADKLYHLPRAALRNSPYIPARRADPQAPFLVYVGDSTTDFDCLMHADAGVWLCPPPPLPLLSEHEGGGGRGGGGENDEERAKRRWREKFRPVDVVPPMRLGMMTANRTVREGMMWAEGLEEVVEFLGQLQPGTTFEGAGSNGAGVGEGSGDGTAVNGGHPNGHLNGGHVNGGHVNGGQVNG